MQTVFTSVIYMSLAAGATGLLIFLTERLTTRVFNATWHYCIRVFLLVLFLVPLSVFMTTIRIDFQREVDFTENTGMIQNQAPARQSMYEYSDASGPFDIEGYQKQKPGVKSGGVVIALLSYVWLSGMLIFILKKLKPYQEFKNTVMARNKEVFHGKAFDILKLEMSVMNINKSVRLMTNDCVGTPMLTGLFRPAIILPDVDMEENELAFIFRHELTHLIHGHLWVKTAAVVSNAIHWFNPISYLLTGSINTLIEMSCDENVVREMIVSERKRYGEVILTTLERAVSMPYGIYPAMCENKKMMKGRLNSMLNYKKAKPVFIALSIVAALLICAIGVTASTLEFGNKENSNSPDDSAGISAADAGAIDNTSPDKVSDRVEETSVVVHLNEKGSRGMIWPVPDSYEVMAYYGKRTNPVSNVEFMHTGIDIKAETGDDITAADKGYVSVAEYRDKYGNTVIIEHSEGITTLYAHCSKLLVEAGDEVEAGQVIAEAGSTGFATGPHLHFEVMIDGQTQNPLEYVFDTVK